MKSFTLCIATMISLVLLSSQACAEQRGWVISEQDKQFLVALQVAAQGKKEDWIASKVSYPLVIHGDTNITVHDSKEFIEHYDQIMNSKVLMAIEQQRPQDLFKNVHGLMIGNGEIWFVPVIPDPARPDSLQYYIIAINN